VVLCRLSRAQLTTTQDVLVLRVTVEVKSVCATCHQVDCECWINRIDSVVLRRLIREVRDEQAPPPTGYDRAYNRHNRNGAYDRAYSRHNR
jgi:hypothetical protein